MPICLKFKKNLVLLLKKKNNNQDVPKMQELVTDYYVQSQQSSVFKSNPMYLRSASVIDMEMFHSSDTLGAYACAMSIELNALHV